MSETLTTVRGNIDSDGSILEGTGFRVTHDRTGLYNIVFDLGTFSDTPTVAATVISNSAKNDKTRYNCVVEQNGLSASGFVMITGDDDGDLSDRVFGFIAVGPPA